MIRAILAIALSVGWLTPVTVAVAQTPSPVARAGDDRQEALSLAYCVIARNAGDVRWFNLLVEGGSSLPDDVRKGAMVNMITAILSGCSGSSAAFGPAFLMARDSIRFHDQAFNLPRRMDGLVRCLATSNTAGSLAFLEASDKAANISGKTEMADIKPLLEKSDCGAALDKVSNAVQANELYSGLNWELRANPQFTALRSTTPSTPVGKQ